MFRRKAGCQNLSTCLSIYLSTNVYWTVCLSAWLPAHLCPLMRLSVHLSTYTYVSSVYLSVCLRIYLLQESDFGFERQVLFAKLSPCQAKLQEEVREVLRRQFRCHLSHTQGPLCQSPTRKPPEKSQVHGRQTRRSWHCVAKVEAPKWRHLKKKKLDPYASECCCRAR